LHRFKHKHIKLKALDNLKDLDTIRVTKGDCPTFSIIRVQVLS